MGAPLIRDTLIRDTLFKDDDEDNAGFYCDYDYDYDYGIISIWKEYFWVNNLG
jgi:hypothetical protein